MGTKGSLYLSSSGGKWRGAGGENDLWSQADQAGPSLDGAFWHTIVTALLVAYEGALSARLVRRRVDVTPRSFLDRDVFFTLTCSDAGCVEERTAMGVRNDWVVVSMRDNDVRSLSGEGALYVSLLLFVQSELRLERLNVECVRQHLELELLIFSMAR